MNAHSLRYRLRQLTLRDKVTASALLLVLMTAVISALNVLSVHDTLRQEKSLKTRELVEAAHSLVEHFHQQQLAGHLDPSTAQAAAMAALRDMRYGNTDYFWINDLREPVPHMLMHPTIPSLVGQRLDGEIFNCATSEQAGLEGQVVGTDGRKNIFVAFNDVVRRAGHGYVTYRWPKPLGDGTVTEARYPKLSYVRIFEPWGWVIGSGIYIDDVERTVLRQIGLNILAWTLLSIAGCIFIFRVHRALTPLTRAAAELDEITRGESPLHPLAVQQQDEVGRLVGSFNRLHELLARETRALEQNRALLLQAQEMARVGHFIFDLYRGCWSSSDMLDQILGIGPAYPRDRDGLLNLCHPDDRGAVAECLNIGACCGETAFNREFRIRRPDTGEERWVHGLGRLEPEAAQLFGVVQDITARKLNEEHQRLAASVFANTHEGIIITDAAANIIDVNQAFSQITGYQREEVLGRNPRLLKSESQSTAFYEALWQDLARHGYWNGEMWNRHKSGQVYAELMNISAVRDDQGRVSHYVGVFTDITPMKEHQYKLERLAHYDPLTGIPNRALLADRLTQAIAHTQRAGNQMAICYLDLDGFKQVNDQFGHKAGDLLLIEMTRRMDDCIRGGDTLARMGGDEFVLLLLDLHSREECETALARLLSAIARPMVIEGQEVSVSASIGVTLFPLDGVDTEILLRHADQVMYRAKQSGKNRYCIFEAGQAG